LAAADAQVDRSALFGKMNAPAGESLRDHAAATSAALVVADQ
jgi:hypothetical protein